MCCQLSVSKSFDHVSLICNLTFDLIIAWVCLSIQQTGESAQLVEILKMPELTTHSAVAQDQNEFKGIMESAQPSTTWLWPEVWPQSEKPDSCSQMEENLEIAISSLPAKGCLIWLLTFRLWRV